MSVGGRAGDADGLASVTRSNIGVVDTNVYRASGRDEAGA